MGIITRALKTFRKSQSDVFLGRNRFHKISHFRMSDSF